MDKEWVSNEDLAEKLDVPLATIRRWRYVGDGPPGIRLGRHVRYNVRDVERWLEERRKTAAP